MGANPLGFTDPKGLNAQVVGPAMTMLPMLAIGYATSSGIRDAVNGMAQRCGNAVSRLANLVFSEEADADLPTDLVGTQDKLSGARGNRHNSGPLNPQNGDTGDAQQDFDKLTGSKNGPAPASGNYPPGSQLGENGVALRLGRPEARHRGKFA